MLYDRVGELRVQVTPLRFGQVSLDEAEQFPAQSSCQRRYAPMVFGIIRNTVRLPFGMNVQLRRNPQVFPKSSASVVEKANLYSSCQE